MARESARCVLTLPLLTEPWQEHILEKRFLIMEDLINSFIAIELRKLKNVQRQNVYRDLEKQIEETPKEDRRDLYLKRRIMLQEAGFSKFAFIQEIAPLQKHYVAHIGRSLASRAAEDVWRSFETYLFGAGNKVHPKRHGDLRSIANVRTGSNMGYQDGVFRWDGGRCENQSTLSIKVAHPKTEYEREMLAKPCRHLRVVRKWVKRRYKYYLQFVLEGTPVHKDRIIAQGDAGLLVGSQAVAVAAQDDVWIRELADQVKDNDVKIRQIRKKMGASIRSMNPDYYDESGKMRKTRKSRKMNKSNHFLRLEGQMRELLRKNGDIRRYQHNCLANDILAAGTNLYVVDVGETSPPGGSERAPALLLLILDRKLKALGMDRIHIIHYQDLPFGEGYRTQLNCPHRRGPDRADKDAALLLLHAAPSMLVQEAPKKAKGGRTKPDDGEARPPRQRSKRQGSYERLPWAQQYQNTGWREVTMEQWEQIAQVLPPDTRKGGRRARVDDRQILNGILRILDGTPWRELPKEYGHWRTVFERYKRWGEDGTLERIFEVWNNSEDRKK